MTERLALGITVGALQSVAVAASGGPGDLTADPVASGLVLTHPSVVRVADGAAPVFGSAATRTGHTRAVLLDGFLDRVGDPVDMLAEDGSTHRAADLTATAVACLIDETASATGRTPDAVVACHPARWSTHTVRAQRAALAEAGQAEVTLVPEQTAAVRWLEAAHGRLGEGAILVYDLGATGLTLSVLRTGAQAGPLGPPLRNVDIAGAEFDLLTMRYVLANALNGKEFDPFDPASERELSALRERCRKAKESLSINTATVVPVHLDPSVPNGQQIRLIRDELEDLLRGPLLTSLALMRDTVHRAGLDIPDISRILLTGGGASIPLVAELISTEFGLPVVAADAPAQTSARGAALLAADLLKATVAPSPRALILPPPAEAEAVATTPIPRAPTARVPEPPTPSPPRHPARGRAAVIASAAVLIALLAGGTVAIGTGGDSGTGPPSDRDAATTEQTTPTGAGSASVQPAADPLTPGSQPSTGAPPGAPASGAPGSTAVSVANGARPDQTGNTQGQPGQTGQPQGQDAPRPAPAPDSPAPQQSQTQPQPQPAPQPQPQPTQQVPAPTQPSLPKPQTPSLPTGVLSDTIDGVGGAVGTVLRVPGEVLGGNGG
ncbi:Hsp70 family protein [Nocardia arizonensis]|uniref:Hsp70 family protein n=1 Tax=Nocardia arizonensis TaxID=1141647 RepID=UPI0006D1C035|nr:Hsp70 family protein [Nocardia arizonensis]